MARLPDINLLCMEPRFATAFAAAATTIFPDLHSRAAIAVHECSLRALPAATRFDAVVSPANSYARLDGAFDDALARAYGPARDYGWITRKAQRVLYERWRGYAPPGTCTVVRLDRDGDDDEEQQDDGETARRPNPWGTQYLLLCPTMRTPQDVRWDREVVYECVWSLLCAVDNHNRALRAEGAVGGNGGVAAGADSEIRSILMTPLATGCGRVSPKRWAQQCVLAMKHWLEAVDNPDVWARLDWDTIEARDNETRATYEDEL